MREFGEWLLSPATPELTGWFVFIMSMALATFFAWAAVVVGPLVVESFLDSIHDWKRVIRRWRA